MTSVPQIKFTPTGIVVPTEAEILAGVQEDINAAFGGNLSSNLETPQGQLATSQAAILAAVFTAFVQLANSLDPSYASGRFQDALGRYYFLTRNPAQATVVTATCTGLDGVVIPIGAQAVDQSGNIYQSTQSGVISGGSVALSFTCNSTGPIACPIAFLNGIYRSIPGWDSVSNAGAGVEGNDVESRAEFEFRRQQSVAANSQGSLQAILGAVFQVPGVLDAHAVQNSTGSTVAVNGVNVIAHSVYISVYGGAAQAIGNAIWSKISPGCNFNGNTDVTVTDTGNGYTPPYPTYTITFEIPVATPIKFAVSMQANASAPSNSDALIKAAIIAAFNGTDGSDRARIGSSIFASRFYAGLAALGSLALVYSVLLGTSTPTLTSVTMTIAQVPTLVASDIAITYT